MADGSVDLVLLNPPFHVGAGVHAGAGLKMIEAAGRVLAPGGELWTVYNRHLPYLPALERHARANRGEGPEPQVHGDLEHPPQHGPGRARALAHLRPRHAACPRTGPRRAVVPSYGSLTTRNVRFKHHHMYVAEDV